MKKLVSVLAITALGACAPKINPQMKSTTDSMLQSVQAQHSVAAPTSYEPMPWKAGQWSMFKAINEKGEPSILKYSVVAEDASGVWLETEVQDYYQHVITKVLYSRMPKNADEGVDLMQKMITKVDDKDVVEVDYANNPAADMMRSMAKGSMQGSSFISDIEVGNKADQTVAAGTFRGCASTSASVTVGPYTTETFGWFHPAVPVNGLVKSTSKDGRFVMELLDFGASGAKSAL